MSSSSNVSGASPDAIDIASSSDLRARFKATIPLWPVGADGRCTCAEHPHCKRPGKHPARNAPGPGYAVVTGVESGLFVVDPDVKSGVEGITQLEQFLGSLPNDTFTVATPSGGLHFYFVHPGFHVANRKPASAVDIKGDKDREDGLVYVVGPGSPGYVKTSDPCIVTPADPYTVLFEGQPIAQAPEKLLAWLKIGGERASGVAPDPIDESHAEWARRIELAVETCKTFEPSRGDGEGGKRLFAVCIRLVRKLELPIESALDIIAQHFNPRCTQPDGVTAWPWDESDIIHKLEDARDRSDIPCGILSEATERGFEALKEKQRTPTPLRDLVEASVRRQHDPAHAYAYRSGYMSAHNDPKKIPFNSLIEVFTRGKEWSGCWQFDEFEERARCVDPPIKLDAEVSGLSDTDLSTLRAWLEHMGMLVNEKDIGRAVTQAARAASYHPVREYLDALPKGDPEIFDGLAKKLFGTDEPLADDFLRKFMVSAVRRITSPGCQVDTLLVLVGEKQGEGKSQAVQALFTSEWTRLGLPAKSLADRDAAHALSGFWVVELGELVSLVKSSVQESKDYLAKQVDDYRAYGTAEKVKKKRSNVFFGTTNEAEFLRDYANRRFWPIQIPRDFDIPLDWIRQHRDDIWAAAKVLAEDATYRHWYTTEEESNVEAYKSTFLERDAWFEQIAEYCKGRKFVREDEVFAKAVFGDVSRYDNTAKARVVDTLKKLRCWKGKDCNGTVRGWRIPAGITGEASSPEEKTKRTGDDIRQHRVAVRN